MGAFLSHTRCDSSPDYEMLRYALGTLASGEPEEKKKKCPMGSFILHWSDSQARH